MTKSDLRTATFYSRSQSVIHRLLPKWIDKLPPGWRLERLKRICKVYNGSTPRSENPDYWDGNIPWVTPEDLGNLEQPEIKKTSRFITQSGYNSCGTALVPEGSLVLSTRAPIGHLGIASIPLCTNQGCRSLVFLSDDVPKYFYYLLAALCKELQSWGQGSTFKELGKNNLEALFLSRPSLSEQRNIVHFLDRETAKIDALIAKKERLIELLKEKRNAVITQAVTKGLDPNVAMKDCGLDWVGKIPKHWETMKLAYACSLLRDGTHQPPARVDEGLPLLSVRNIVNGRFVRLADDSRIAEADFRALQRSFSVTPGDVVLAIVGATLGKVAVVENIGPVAIQRSVAILRPRKVLLREPFLSYFLQGESFQHLLWQHAGFSAQPGIYLGTLAQFQICIPPITEQERIVNFLEQKTSSTRNLVAKVAVAIEKLRECRTALISAAVTGKIDVREKATAPSNGLLAY